MRPTITLVIAFLLALCSAALTYSTPPAMDETFGDATFFTIQHTTAPRQADLSEIGSTDGILIMGFVIVFIIVIPILLRRKSWREPR